MLARRNAVVQLNVDATRMSQAFTGSGHIQTIVSGEIAAFMQGHWSTTTYPADLARRARFNPELNKS